MTQTNSMSFLMVISPGDKLFLLRKTLNSILEQTFKPFSVTLVLNGVINPEVNEVLKKFQSNFFSICRFVNLTATQPLSHALNKGLRSIEEEITIRIDPDDLSTPDRTKKVARIFFNSEVDVLGSNIIEIDNYRKKYYFRDYPKNNEQIKSKMLWNNQIAHSSVAFKTFKIIALGGYPNIYKQEDYGLWLIAIKNNLFLENNEGVLSLMNINGMHKRRTGYRLMRSEFDIMKIKINMQIYSFHKVLISYVLRSLYHVFPSIWKKYIHSFLLRKPADSSLLLALVKDYSFD